MLVSMIPEKLSNRFVYPPPCLKHEGSVRMLAHKPCGFKSASLRLRTSPPPYSHFGSGTSLTFSHPLPRSITQHTLRSLWVHFGVHLEAPRLAQGVQTSNLQRQLVKKGCPDVDFRNEYHSNNNKQKAANNKQQATSLKQRRWHGGGDRPEATGYTAAYFKIPQQS